MTPLERLRTFLGDHHELKSCATQAGLARLIGKSETLVRSLERSRAKVSSKVANLLSEATGCDPQWLQTEMVEVDCPIPALGGGQLDHLQVLERFTRRIDSNLEKIQPSAVVSELAKRRLLDGLLGMVEAEVLHFWESSVDVCPDPITELLDWLRKRAEIRNSHTVVRSPSIDPRDCGNDGQEKVLASIPNNMGNEIFHS